MKLLILSIVLLSLAFAGIAIKIWAKKGGEFDGTCSGKNVKLKEKGIVCCGKDDCHESDEDKIEIEKVS